VTREPGDAGGLRSEAEKKAAIAYATLFDSNPEGTERKLRNFGKYIRHQDLTAVLARYEIFTRILRVKGSIIECGVWRGAGLMTWANLSAILEPTNLTRRIYGLDTFTGFTGISEEDSSSVRTSEAGQLCADSFDELLSLIDAYDANRCLGHVPKVSLMRGDAVVTIPKLVATNPHLLVSLLFLDFDLYEPTKCALEHFVPRMPRGAIVAFDELDNPAWPGETLAMLEEFAGRALRLQRLQFDPYISFARL